MTSTSSDKFAEAVADNQFHIAYNYIIYALSALAIYEYLISFSRELDTIWRRKFSGATVLFLLNRYLLFPFLVVDWSGVEDASPLSCLITLRVWKAIYFTQFAIIAGFATLRVYAISDRNILYSSVVLSVSLVPILTSIYYETTLTVVYDDSIVSKCYENTSTSSTKVFSLALVTRISFILSDALVLALTWWKARPSQGWCSTSIYTLLLRDGTVHFTILLTMNIAEVVILHYPQLQFVAFGSIFFNVLTPILISRFLLNLRQLPLPEDRLSRDSFAVSTAFGSFAGSSSVVGNLGQPLDYGFENEPDSLENELNDTCAPGEVV